MADPETVQSRPPLETTTLRQGRGVPLGALVCDQVEYVTASASVSVERDLYVVNTTSGSVTMTLPALSTVALGKAFTFYKPVAANSMIVDGYSSETIEGAANETRTAQYAVVTVCKVQTGAATYAWMLAKADLTAGAIADGAVDSSQIANGAVDPVHLAAVSVAPAANAAAALLNTTTEALLTVTDATNTAISTTSSVAGQVVFLRAVAVSGGGSYTLAVTGGTLTLNATGEAALVQRNVANDAWLIVAHTAGVGIAPDGSIDSAQIATAAVDPVHLAAVSVAPAADAAAAILNTTTEVLVSTASGANTAISTTSSVAGQRVFLRMTAAAGGGSYTLVVSGGTLTLNSVGETAAIVRNVANSAWHVVSLTAGDAAGAAATVV